MIGSLNNALSGYQRKIGYYDKHSWERTLEERVLQGLHRFAAPKKVTQVNTELLDLDLIRGSPFTKRKPQVGWLSSICTSVVRVLFMPLCADWWREQTAGNRHLMGFFLVLYLLQAMSMYVYFQTDSSSWSFSATADTPGKDTTRHTQNTTRMESDESLKPHTSASSSPMDQIPPSEVLAPLFMMIIITIIQTQIAASGAAGGVLTAGNSSGSGLHAANGPAKRSITTLTNGSVNAAGSAGTPLAGSSNGINNLTGISRRSPQRGSIGSYSQRTSYRSTNGSISVSGGGGVGTGGGSSGGGGSGSGPSMPTIPQGSGQGKLAQRAKRRRLKGDRTTPSVAESVLETPRPDELVDQGEEDEVVNETSRRVPAGGGPRGPRLRRRTKGSDEESGFDSIDLAGQKRAINNQPEDESHPERRMSLSERRGVARDNLNLNLTTRIPLIEVTTTTRARNNQLNDETEGGNSASASASASDDPSPVGPVAVSSAKSRSQLNGAINGKLRTTSGTDNLKSTVQIDPETLWTRRYSDITSDKHPPGLVHYVNDDRRFSDDTMIRHSLEQDGVHGSSAADIGIPAHPRSRAQSCNSPPLSVRPTKKCELEAFDVLSDTHLTHLLSPPGSHHHGMRSIHINSLSHSHHHHHQARLASRPVVRGSRSHPHTHRHNHRCSHRRAGSCSTDCESDDEGTISPTTPTKMGGAASDLDWPMINSENSSEEGEEEVDEEAVLNSKTEPLNQKIQPTNNTTSPEHSLPGSGTATGTDRTPVHAHQQDQPPPSYYSYHSTGNAYSSFSDYFDVQRFSEDIPHPIFSLPEMMQPGDLTPDLRPLNPTSGNMGIGSANGMKNGTNTVSCAIWQQNECQKVDLTVLDISSSIVRKVDISKHSNEYLYVGFVCSFIMALIPGLYRMKRGNFDSFQSLFNSTNSTSSDANHGHIRSTRLINGSEIFVEILPNLTIDIFLESFFGSHLKETFVMSIAMFERFCIGMIFFFLVCVAEKTFRQRFLIAKYFCHLTSSRRAKRSDLPHFRLNKVRNIKSWLSIRSYLKKHGPQRSVDVIVSGSFMLAVSILTFVCLQLLRDDENDSSDSSSASSHFHQLYCWEMIFADLAIGIFIMRLMILGLKINDKYRSNLSILITEQINLYLQQEQKPHKKEELTLANHVLKLAADLLKQLESPFKISGFSANPYLYNLTKVVVLSAFSAVISEILGFKLKLHKIKIAS